MIISILTVEGNTADMPGDCLCVPSRRLCLRDSVLAVVALALNGEVRLESGPWSPLELPSPGTQATEV